MYYTIKRVGEKVKLSVYTLRYYDKEGLLPFVERDHSGKRLFTENDIEWLSVICCLKNTGMPIKEIRKYIELCLEEDDSVENRRLMLTAHRDKVIGQINDLNHNLEKIEHKIKNIDSACKLYRKDTVKK